MDSERAGSIADWALAAVIVLAPIAGGSSNLYVLPALATLTALAFGASLFHARASGHSFHVPFLAIGCAILAGYTWLQTLPLPEGAIERVSPHAFEVRSLVSDAPSRWPISYEPASTAREAAKLLIYAMIVAVAAERMRLRRRFEPIAAPIVIAGLAAAGLALIHRLLGIEHIFGILPSHGWTSFMLTTFANPNHAAGFMNMASLVAVGLALNDRARDRQLGYLIAAIICGVVSVSCISRGGISALAIGYVLLGLALLRLKAKDPEKVQRLAPLMIAAALVLPLAGFALQYEPIIEELRGTMLKGAGVSEKIAAVKDALPMTADHAWLGIGRGAYISIYPQYKSSALALTFAFPENIAAQLVSEWGAVVGLLALAGLSAALIIRLVRARTVAIAAALIGVTAVVIQNLVDFSLELPGVAIPAAAILGAAGADRVRRLRLRFSSLPPVVACFVVPVALMGLWTSEALQGGDVLDDLIRLERYARSAHDHASPIDPARAAEVRKIAERHPASGFAAAQVAYLHEIADPPDLPGAIRWGNRAIYLAPTYSDAHLLLGRILVRAGQRALGFAEMRRAWMFAGGGEPRVIEQILGLARNADEITIAVPRRDPLLDAIDPVQLARIANFLKLNKGNVELARSVLSKLGSIDALAPATLSTIATLASTIDPALSERAIARLRVLEPDNPQAALVYVQLLGARGERAKMKAVLADVLENPRIDPSPFLRARLDLAIGEKDEQGGREALKRLELQLPPTRATQGELARLEATLERRLEHPARAVSALDHAVRLAPEDLPLRAERASLLKLIGRARDARVDLEFILVRDPNDRAARQMLDEIRAATASGR